MSEESRRLPSRRRKATETERELRERILRHVRAGSAAPILLSGGIGDGKTSTAERLAKALKDEGIHVGGIVAPRRMAGEETVGYDVVDLATGERRPFATTSPPGLPAGRFHISPAGLAFAAQALRKATGAADVVFVDEVGRLELGGEGHAPAVRDLLASSSTAVLSVRETFLEEVVDAFGLAGATIVRVSSSAGHGRGQDASAEEFWSIIDSIPFPLLVTHGEDGYPQSRPMHLIEREGAILWFATSRSSRKVAQIGARPEATALFVDSERFNYASLHGRAEIIDDTDRERKLWQDEWADDWPEGPSDPDYVLLRVAGVRGFYLRGFTGKSGEIDLT